MHLHESTIQEQYNQLAHIYDWRWGRYIANTLVFFKAWAKIPPAAAVLDVACGTGELERLLLNDNPDQIIVGIDLSGQMLSQARQKLSGYTNVSFQQVINLAQGSHALVMKIRSSWGTLLLLSQHRLAKPFT